MRFMSEKRIRRSGYVVVLANLLLLGILAIQPSISSAETYWTDQLDNGATTLSESVINKHGTGEFREVSFDLPSLRAALTPTMAKSSYAPIISFPQPDGGFKRFVVEPSGIIPEALSAKFPHLLTYKGYAIDDPTISIRFEVTDTQINAQILEPGNRWMIDAQPSRGEGRAISFYSGKTLRQSGAQFCELETPHSSKEKEHSQEKKSLTESQAAKSRGDILRTYRLAVATTGEYGQFHGGQTASVLDAVATTINRVVGILEQEVSISLVLVENNEKILYTIGLNDPFTGNSDASTLIDESQSVIDTQIGADNYDIGHTLSTGAGGLAALGSVCSSGYKARGVTGSGQPQGEYFDVDFVAHEIGHQLGANHTFNGSSGGCSGGNRNYLTAYEPGSGSTIQAYPSLCGPDDLQNSVDPIYHSESFEEIYDFVTEGDGASCGVTDSTGNTPPQVNAGADYTVPRGTPLVLNGSAVDAEQSNLTFLWEQRDLGDQAALSAPDDGEIPLFRVFTPSTRSDRYLPRLNAVVSGNFSDDEKIPQVAREMDFRLTARDGVGGVSSDDMVVSVVASAGPFVISSPNGGESVGRSKTITWDVANTDQEPVSTSEVEVLLSTNGGVTFDQSLGTVPNDGSANLTFPAGLQTSSARIMIKAANSIFYDVSDANFELDSDRLVPASPTRASVSPSNGGATIQFTPGEDNGVSVTSYVAACSSSDSTEEFSYSIQPDLFFSELAAVSSTLAVDADLEVESGGLKVPVNISHTYRGDVVISLTSPSGTSVTLKTNLGSDEGVDVIGIYPDTLAPEQSLDGFVGESVAGDWVLNVSDAYEEDQGTFNSWGLTFLRVTAGDEVTQSASQSPILLSGLNNGVTYSCQVTAYAGDDPSEVVNLGSVTPTETSHTVTPSAGEGGSISPSTPQSVTEGASVEFELTPEEGYRVDNVGGSCGGSLSGTTFTTNAITQDCSVVIQFASESGLPLWMIYITTEAESTEVAPQ